MLMMRMVVMGMVVPVVVPVVVRVVMPVMVMPMIVVMMPMFVVMMPMIVVMMPMIMPSLRRRAAWPRFVMVVAGGRGRPRVRSVVMRHLGPPDAIRASWQVPATIQRRSCIRLPARAPAARAPHPLSY
jgi:hypothetical protein